MTILTTQDPIEIVQITDTHLYGKSSGTLLKMNTRDSFDYVIDLIKTNNTEFDLLLSTGDITQDASVESYNIFLEIVSTLDIPFRWIPGNHDNAALMANAAQGTDAGEKTVQINNWLIILLDTSILGQVHGKLATTELKFLQSTLATADEDDSIDHCFITLHHNPVPGTAGWMKDIGLQNDGQFFDIAKKSDKLKCISYGHIHQELDFEHEGIRCLCTPSTCIQFKPKVTSFRLDKVNPGYRTLKLLANGEIETEVVRVSGSTFEADYSSPGY